MATSTAPQSDTADPPENSTTSVDANVPRCPGLHFGRTQNLKEPGSHPTIQRLCTPGKRRTSGDRSQLDTERFFSGPRPSSVRSTRRAGSGCPIISPTCVIAASASPVCRWIIGSINSGWPSRGVGPCGCRARGRELRPPGRGFAEASTPCAPNRWRCSIWCIANSSFRIAFTSARSRRGWSAMPVALRPLLLALRAILSVS